MQPTKIWTVAEAKARLSEILRRAAEEGPQRIGARNRFVVVPESLWRSLADPQKTGLSMGEWLIEHMPRGEPELLLPSRTERSREIPFIDERES